MLLTSNAYLIVCIFYMWCHNMLSHSVILCRLPFPLSKCDIIYELAQSYSWSSSNKKKKILIWNRRNMPLSVIPIKVWYSKVNSRQNTSKSCFADSAYTIILLFIIRSLQSLLKKKPYFCGVVATVLELFSYI